MLPATAAGPGSGRAEKEMSSSEEVAHMNPVNILIGTAILWGLKGLFVLPLTKYWVGRRLAEPAYAPLRGPDLSEADKATLQSLATKCFILADVLVLGAAGLLAGLLGYFFIGIS
jgi:hypothetical protein